MVPDLLLGVRVELGPAERHPAMLGRDLTCLDLACGGRSVLCFAPPFTEQLAEAAHLCRALWRAGEVVGSGPHYPVQAAAGRARPTGERSPLIAFDLTRGDELPDFLAGAGDLRLRAVIGTPETCLMEQL